MIKIRTEVEVALIVQQWTTADKVIRLCYPVELEHRGSHTPDTVGVSNINVNRVPGSGLGNDIVVMLTNGPRTLGFPLCLCGRPKYFWVMNARTIEPCQYKGDPCRGDNGHADNALCVEFDHVVTRTSLSALPSFI